MEVFNSAWFDDLLGTGEGDFVVGADLVGEVVTEWLSVGVEYPCSASRVTRLVPRVTLGGGGTFASAVERVQPIKRNGSRAMMAKGRRIFIGRKRRSMCWKGYGTANSAGCYPT